VPPAAIVEPPQKHAQEHELPDELADAPLLVPERSLWRWIVLGLLVAALIAGLVYAIAF
jgi:hypothetical protein